MPLSPSLIDTVADNTTAAAAAAITFCADNIAVAAALASSAEFIDTVPDNPETDSVAADLINTTADNPASDVTTADFDRYRR